MHNSLQVIRNPAGIFASNLHLFHHYVPKDYIRIFCLHLHVFGLQSCVCCWGGCRSTWLDDDGPAASPLPLFPVASGAQPALSVSLQHHHPGYHLPQQQVQLLHMVVSQKNLPGTRSYLWGSTCCHLQRTLLRFPHMILLHLEHRRLRFNVCITFVVPSTQFSSLARSRMVTAFSLLVSGIWWARNAR